MSDQPDPREVQIAALEAALRLLLPKDTRAQLAQLLRELCEAPVITSPHAERDINIATQQTIIYLICGPDSNAVQRELLARYLVDKASDSKAPQLQILLDLAKPTFTEIQPRPVRLMGIRIEPAELFRVGTRIELAIKPDREGYLLLLHEGASGQISCLCPSRFAPNVRISPDWSILPQSGSPRDAFVIEGQPGRDYLLAIITNEPIESEWRPADSAVLARTLSQDDINLLLAQLCILPRDQWTAWYTWFDVIA